MAYIILQSRRTRQPQGAVRVLSPVANPQVAWLGSSLLVNWVTGAGGTLLGGTPGVDISGRSINFPGGWTGGVSFPVTTQPQTKFTIIAVFRKRVNFPYGSIYSFSGINSSVNFGENGASYFYGFNKGGVVGLNNIALSDGIFVAVASLRQDTGEYYTLIKPFSDGSILRAAGIDTEVSTASNGAQIVGGGYALDGGISLLFSAFDFLPESNAVQYLYNPWQLFAPEPRRLYFGASGGGATIITTSGAASLVARAAAAVTATKIAAAASRATIASTASTTSIRTSALVAKANSAGAAATTTIRTATIAARTANTGTAATTTLRTGLAASRIASNAQTTYAAIVAGAFTAAGRTSARGAAAYTSTHAATAAATTTTRGAASATTLRDGIAAARLDARAAVTAAALVAGTVTTSAAAQIGARASVSNTTERSAALAAMLALRGANPAAPALPVIVPPSTRSLFPDHARLGLSPVAPAKPRLG